MTKEEAKLVLDNARPQTKEIDRQFYDDEDLNNAIDMAIKALEQPTSDDCVSRQAVLDKAWDVPYEGKYIQVVDVGDIQELPPVTPTRKVGKWIRVDHTKVKCSNCDITHLIAQYPHGVIDYCPNCGSYNQSIIENER